MIERHHPLKDLGGARVFPNCPFLLFILPRMTYEQAHRDVAHSPLSLSYYTVPELSFLEMVEVAADIGCQHVALRLLDGAPTEPGTELLESAQARRQAVAHMSAFGVSALDGSAVRIRATTQPSTFSTFLNVSAELGARQVMCSIDDTDHARSASNLAEVCTMAKPLGLQVGIEFVPWMSVGTLTDAVDLITQLDMENLGIVVDALHFDRSKGSLSEINALPPNLIQMFQICDAPACADFSAAAQLHVATQARLLPGDGAIDLQALYRAMPREAPVAMEIPMTDLSRSVPAIERARLAAAATRATLALAVSDIDPG